MGDNDKCYDDDLYRHGAETPSTGQCVDDRLPVGEGGSSAQPQKSRMRRGPQKSNPVKPVRLRLWRGTGKGVQPTRHGEAGIIHDFGHGRNGVAPLFFADSYWLGEQYSRTQGRGDAGCRPIVYLWEGDWSQLNREFGRRIRILDLTQGEAGQQWHRFATQKVGTLSRLELMRQSVGDKSAYWPFFQEFLRSTNRDLDTFDVIVGPEYVRGGKQISIRDGRLQKIMTSKWHEYVRRPVWVRVVDARGVAIDVDINHPDAGEANRKYVRQRQQVTERKQKVSPSRTSRLAPTPARGPVVAPGTKGVAGVLAIIEIARIILELVATIRQMPSEFQIKLREARRKHQFWKKYGVRSAIAAMVTDGKARVGRGGPVKSAKGRVLYGLIPEDWDDVDEDDFEFFLAAVDSVRAGPKNNPLDKNLTSLGELARFLAEGWRVPALVPYANDIKSNLTITQWTWHIRVQRPATDGSAKVENQHFSIRAVINRIRRALLQAEQLEIAKTHSLTTPGGSRPRDRFDGGAFVQTINKSRLLTYRDEDDRPFYSVMYGSRELGDEDLWGKVQARFYQVGPDNLGDPFLFAGARLVTGADAATNEVLWSALARYSSRSLVTEYQATLPAGRGGPIGWVHLPMVYVKKDDVH